ncbi:PoNi-like cognate immunity protein [Listeria booriae]|uniref:DUF1911 domain-containing protein n=1 Tax=Listeria booriae TaxID=1552123 RepID=A0A7X1DGE1_9LIST|nr:PoNi-like cognate immunity protein [Listeria booriae]MBC1649719.1 DUF1911 domain-containing protein [Listeria booriae]MBC2284346.1 DUF1911 domain-containing protein [Listeria booriae]MBC2292746.1 DUF1911 domain-containing protein [Listeria booriae]MBC2304007.1 DUF1911 domain-containing protein [Listeria booriae]MBC6163047.1 DUF1911 domain-containing protein [Listeria booriae]
MIRDTKKDKQYFIDFIQYENQSIKKFKNAVNSVIETRGEDDQGVRSGYNFLLGLHFSKLNALYSSGATLEEIKEFIPEIIDIMEKAWKSESCYVEMVWLLSVGIMLEIPEEQMKRLQEIVKSDGAEDYLLNYLMKNDCGNSVTTSPFLHDVPYKSLQFVIESDGEVATNLLKQYLSDEWYAGHDDMGWYDSDKSKEDIYSGYWSFESGAIAKIKGLDDTDLKTIEFYPYDLVHYK